MRPGFDRERKKANPVTAVLYGVVVTLVVGYGLSYLAGRVGMGVITGPASVERNAFTLAGLNLYASQHITLMGSGISPGETARIHATMTFPVTLWAVIPALALMIGGFVAARVRTASGRWGMIGAALAAGVIYAAVLAGFAGLVSAKFISSAIPAVQGWEVNPPDIPFRPSVVGTLIDGSLFAIVFSYLGGLIAARDGPGPSFPGKWWACAKAVVIVGLTIQALMALGLWTWFATSSRLREEDRWAQPKFAQMLPTAAGMGYALVHGATLSCAAVPVNFPSASYAADMQLYRGIAVREQDKTTHKPLGRWVWIAALIGAIAALASGRLAVRLGSRDGSLPTAARITILQSAYIGVIMLMCSMGWGIAGQSSVSIGPRYDSAMLFAGAGILVLSLVGAHLANRRYAGRLSGFPSV